MEKETSKITTKEWFACSKCEEKLETINLGSDSSNLMGLFSTNKAMYCNNKECKKYGDLTVVGIKKSE